MLIRLIDAKQFSLIEKLNILCKIEKKNYSSRVIMNKERLRNSKNWG